MAATNLYLCVDCGGTKTAAAIATSEGKVIARGTGGPSNFTDVGLTKFTISFTEAVTSALTTALTLLYPNKIHEENVKFPLPSHLLHAAWVGVSGVDSPAAVETLTKALAPLLALPAAAPHLIIANDTHLLASPLRLHSDIDTAVVTIAGTGSIAVSFRIEQTGSLQELGRVGGWGWLLGDEGSGYHVGREAIREILRRADRASLATTTASTASDVNTPVVISASPRPTLQERIFSLFDITSPFDIFRVIYSPDPGQDSTYPLTHPLSKDRKHRIAQLTPIVFESAFTDGDELALTVLRISAGTLAIQIASLLRKDDSSDSPPNAIDASKSILCFGGTLVSIKGYRDLVLEELAKLGHVFRYAEYVDDVTGLGAVGLASVVA